MNARPMIRSTIRAAWRPSRAVVSTDLQRWGRPGVRIVLLIMDDT